MCWAKEFGEASEEERVAQLAARYEGQADGGVLAEGQLDEGRADTQKIQLEEEETERLRAENGELRAEVEKIKAAKQPAKIIAAGGGAAAARVQVRSFICRIYGGQQWKGTRTR